MTRSFLFALDLKSRENIPFIFYAEIKETENNIKFRSQIRAPSNVITFKSKFRYRPPAFSEKTRHLRIPCAETSEKPTRDKSSFPLPNSFEYILISSGGFSRGKPAFGTTPLNNEQDKQREKCCEANPYLRVFPTLQKVLLRRFGTSKGGGSFLKAGSVRCFNKNVVFRPESNLANGILFPESF